MMKTSAPTSSSEAYWGTNWSEGVCRDFRFGIADRRFVRKICTSDYRLSKIDFRESIIARADLCYKSAGVNPKSETQAIAKCEIEGFMEKTEKKKNRRFSREFKIAAVRRVLAGEHAG